MSKVSSINEYHLPSATGSTEPPIEQDECPLMHPIPRINLISDVCIFASLPPTGLFCRWSQREMAKRTCTETWLHCKAVSVASEFLKFHLQTHMDSNHLDLVDPDFLFVLDLFWLKKPHLQFVFGISFNLTLYKEVQLFSSRCHRQCCLALAVSKSCHCLSIVKQIRLSFILKSFDLFGYLRDSPWYSWYAKDVNWLTGLNEPPQDVLDLLEFFLSRAPCREIWGKLGCIDIVWWFVVSSSLIFKRT